MSTSYDSNTEIKGLYSIFIKERISLPSLIFGMAIAVLAVMLMPPMVEIQDIPFTRVSLTTRHTYPQ